MIHVELLLIKDVKWRKVCGIATKWMQVS